VCKGKGESQPRAGHESPEGVWRYSSTFSLTWALDWVGWSTPSPSCFIFGKETRHILCRRSCGPQGRSGRVRKISPTPGLDLRTAQTLASSYTDPHLCVCVCVCVCVYTYNGTYIWIFSDVTHIHPILTNIIFAHHQLSTLSATLKHKEARKPAESACGKCR
jgi:hypothetical protein